MNKNILPIVFLMAGMFLATTAVTTTMVPAAYAGGDDGDGNKAKAEDESITQLIDCDDNEQEAEGAFVPAVCVADAFIGEP
jgi:hypothetical protein